MVTFDTSEHFKILFPYLFLPKQIVDIVKHDSLFKI